MVDRPDFSTMFDASGNALVPADTPHEQLISDIEDEPSPIDPRRDVSPSSPAPVKAGTELYPYKGDWGKQPATALAQVEHGKVVQKSGLPDWDKPRGEDGRYLSKSETEMRASWDREMGSDRAIAQILATETAFVNASENPAALKAHIATLDRDVMLAAADYLRLSPAGFGRWDTRFESFLNGLSEKQFAQFHTWWKGLTRADADNILHMIGIKL